MGQKSILWVIVIATIITLFFLIIFINNITLPAGSEISRMDYNGVDKTIRFELVKYLMQLLIVVIIGGAIAYAYKGAEENKKSEAVRNEETRKESKIKSEIRQDYFDRLGNIYREVKSARRTLRTVGLTTKYKKNPGSLTDPQVHVYLEQMTLINKYQLQLEGLKIEARSLPAFLQLNNIAKLLKLMDDYLGNILGEYEEYCPLLKSDQRVEFLKLKRLDEFTGEIKYKSAIPVEQKKEYNFKNNFSRPYADVIQTLGKSIE